LLVASIVVEQFTLEAYPARSDGYRMLRLRILAGRNCELGMLAGLGKKRLAKIAQKGSDITVARTSFFGKRTQKSLLNRLRNGGINARWRHRSHMRVLEPHGFNARLAGVKRPPPG